MYTFSCTKVKETYIGCYEDDSSTIPARSHSCSQLSKENQVSLMIFCFRQFRKKHLIKKKIQLNLFMNVTCSG